MTEHAPVVSRLQLLAAEEGSSELLIDEGVTRVWVDIRQPYATDQYSLTGPDGGAIETGDLDEVVRKQDMREADLLGGWLDLLAWTPRKTGTYRIDSDAPYAATVRLEGGGTLEFWIAPDPDDLLVPTNEALFLYAAVRDAEAQPLVGAEVTATVRNLTDQSQIDEPSSFHFVPTRTPGIYVHELDSGLSEGVHSIGVTAIAGNLRRDVAVTVAALDTASLAGEAIPQFMVDRMDRALAEAGAGSTCVRSVPGSKAPGTWFPLHQPSIAVDPGLPVVVFQHGILADHDDWTVGELSPFSTYTPIAPVAVDANYRVALTNLEPNGHVVDNAIILNDCLKDIVEYYDVKQVVIVAHSKGGPDTDNALMTFGSERAQTVITLVSPHRGTPLADLIAIFPRDIQLALLGSGAYEGTIGLTTGERSTFHRTMGDNYPADFRTFNAWDYTFDDSYRLGWIYRFVSGPVLADPGLLLGGLNDGLVTYKGSIRPPRGPAHSTEVLDKEHPDTRVNHSWIKDAARMWRHIKGELEKETTRYDNSPSAPDSLDAEASSSRCSIELRWIDQAKWESGFEVERSIDGEAFDLWNEVDPPAAQTTGALVTSHDESVQSGSTYRYRVRAFVENPRDDSRWYSTYEASNSIALPNTSDCQSEGPHSVSFLPTVNQPTQGGSRKFEATVTLHAEPPEGTNALPLEGSVGINQDSGGLVHTFPVELDDGWTYNVEVVRISQDAAGQPIASCDVTGGTGTIDGGPVALDVTCDVEARANFDVFWEARISTPSGDAPDSFNGSLLWRTRPPEGSNAQPIEEIFPIIPSNAPDPNGTVIEFGALATYDEWSWEVSSGYTSFGFCSGGGQGQIAGENALPGGEPAATFECIEWDMSDCDDPENLGLPWCYVDPGAPGCLYTVRRHVWTCPQGNLDQCVYVGSYVVTRMFTLSPCGSSLRTSEGEAGQTAEELTHAYIRTQVSDPWSGTVVVNGVARNDTYGTSEIELYVDGEPLPVNNLELATYDPYTCLEVSSSSCNPNSGFSAEIDTTALSNGQHTLTVMAKSLDAGGEFVSGGSHDLEFEVYNGTGSSPPCTDTTPPQVSFTEPPDGAVLELGEQTTLKATAIDDESGVEKVEFWAFGSVLGTDYTPDPTGSGYSYDWTPQHEITYVLYAVATDNCGNESVAQPHTVQITDSDPPPPPGPQNCPNDTTPPDVLLMKPEHDSNLLVNGSYYFKAEADDDNGIDRVEFLVDGAVVATDYEPAHELTHIYDAPWTPFETGSPQVRARAWDVCGNDRDSFAHTVNINAGGPSPPPPPPCSDPEPPAVSITTPAEGSTHVSGEPLTVAASATDDVTRVDFYRNGLTLIGSDQTPPYQINWTPSGVGSPKLTARAYDECNETVSDEVTIHVVSDPCSGDTTGPDVQITWPEAGELVIWEANEVRASATDPSGVDYVDFHGMGPVVRDHDAPWIGEWTDPELGPAYLRAHAVDTCGNASDDTVYVEVVEQPTPETQPE